MDDKRYLKLAIDQAGKFVAAAGFPVKSRHGLYNYLYKYLYNYWHREYTTL